MFDFSTDVLPTLLRKKLSSLQTGDFFILRTNRNGQPAVYTKFLTRADRTALAVERSVSRRDIARDGRVKNGDPYKFSFNIAHNIEDHGDYDVCICEESFGNKNDLV